MTGANSCLRCGTKYIGRTSICLKCAILNVKTRTKRKYSAPQASDVRKTEELPKVEVTLGREKRLPKVKRNKKMKEKRAQKKKIQIATPKGRGASRPSTNGVGCPLCGEVIARGSMLEHKQSAHGERIFVHSPAQPHHDNQWVPVFSGGLPSLGKNSK
jgi:hypothetical protein